jgi:dockerin type I repeat protein
MQIHRRCPAILALLAGASLAGQEFEFGIAAPDGIRLNATFEAAFTLTSRGIPSTERGTQAWSLSVAHQGLQIVSVTRKNTVVADLLNGGFAVFEMTHSSTENPDNDGFVSGVILSTSDPDITLPPQGTATVARASYYVGPSACSGGAHIFFRDGLVGVGQPIRNTVNLNSVTYLPILGKKDYGGCQLNDYHLHFGVPADPFPLHLGERGSYALEVRLAQAEATASGFTLAVAHDQSRFQIARLSIQGTPGEGLLSQDGFVLFEITSGNGNAGFTAQVELDPGSRAAIPAPDQPIARCEYTLAPISDPQRVGEMIDAAFRFPASLRGSGGIITNQVFPPGNLTVEDVTVHVEVRSAARFIRGDANGDGQVDLSDCLAVIFYLFQGRSQVCLEAGNANDDGRVDISDVIALLGRLFQNGPELPAPAGECGVDPSLPSLGCGMTTACPE